MHAMPAPASPAPMTAEEYLARPFADDGRRRELIEGEVVVTEPSFRHQDIVGALYSELRTWARAADDRGFASLNIDTAISERSVFAPDAQWYRAGREFADPDVRPQAVGDLVIEVRSPSTWQYDIGIKRSRYESLGVAELWLVDTPARTILVFRRSSPDVRVFDVALELGDAHTLTSPLLPGFALALGDVFG